MDPTTLDEGSTRYRLPTEAEWECAAKANQEFEYAGSDNIDKVAWYKKNSNSQTHGVGQKKANGFGLFDMTGNVREWCWDWKCDYDLGKDYSKWKTKALESELVRLGLEVLGLKKDRVEALAFYKFGSDPIRPLGRYYLENKQFKVLRGGCWDRVTGYAPVSRQSGYYPSYRRKSQGFRLCRTL